jgi:hypothetical protein
VKYSSGDIGIGTTTPTNYGIGGNILKNLQITGSTYGVATVNAGSIFAWLIADNAGGHAATGTQSNHPFLFTTNNVERMRITSTGNVGIGTTIPGHKTVIQTANDTVGLLVTTNANETETGLYIRPDNSTGTIKLFASGNADKTFAFLTGNTERMRLTSGGDLCINATATSGSAKLYVNGLAVFGSVQVGSLGTGLVYSSSGTLTSTNPSDERLKDNINDINWGLSDILKLRPVSYHWKNDKINQGVQFGFIAQEVQEVMPEAIKEFGEDIKYLGLEKDAIYAALVNAIKELKSEIDELKAKIK